MLLVLGILGLITITTRMITSLYTEVSGVEKGVSVDDTYPVSDSQRKV